MFSQPGNGIWPAYEQDDHSRRACGLDGFDQLALQAWQFERSAIHGLPDWRPLAR